MGKRGPKPKLLIDTSWRPELAYVVGLIASDGCLSPDGRHIDLTSKDIDQLQSFKRILGIEHIVIRDKKSGYGNTVCYRVQFGSVVFYEWLMSIGLSPRKSHTIGAILVPDEFLPIFCEGFLMAMGAPTHTGIYDGKAVLCITLNLPLQVSYLSHGCVHGLKRCGMFEVLSMRKEAVGH